MTKTRIAAAVLAVLLPAAAVQAQTAAPKPAPAATTKPAPAAPAAAPAAPATPQGKVLYTQAMFDLLLRERMAQGQPDTVELRAAVRDELNTRELLLREAKKKNLDKNAELKQQMELASQIVLVRAYVSEWVRSNPIPEADLRKEYDSIKSTIGDREYKVAHILVDKEDDAKAIVEQLKKTPGDFAKIAKERSKDPGSKDNGGDLDWGPSARYVKPFADAVTSQQKGAISAAPVKTDFGYHIIRVDDVRPLKVPEFAEVKEQFRQRAQQQQIQRMVMDLRQKAKIEDR